MATLPHSREVLNIDQCPADQFDEAYIHVSKGQGIAHGYFSYLHGALRRYLLLKDGELLCAAWDDGSGGEATPLQEFFEPFQVGPRSLTFHETEDELIEIIGASWQQTPDAHSTPGLIDPNQAIRALLKSNKHVAMRLRREQTYSFAVLGKGTIHSFYSGEPNQPGGRPADALAAALAVRPEELAFDVYENPQAAKAEDWAIAPADFKEGMVQFYSSTAPHLMLFLGERELKRVALSSGQMSIGRDPSNNIVIDNLSVSRKHAVVSFIDGKCIIEDLESANGTFVDGKRIEKQFELKDGQEAVIGKHAVRFIARAVRQEKIPGAGGLDQTIFMRMPAISMPSSQKEPILTVGGQSVPIKQTPFSIGADPTCDLPLQGKGIKPQHAQIKQDAGGQLWISHEAGVLSTTRINGQKVKVAPLRSGDLLQLGSVLVRFHMRD